MENQCQDDSDLEIIQSGDGKHSNPKSMDDLLVEFDEEPKGDEWDKRIKEELQKVDDTNPNLQEKQDITWVKNNNFFIFIHYNTHKIHTKV